MLEERDKVGNVMKKHITHFAANSPYVLKVLPNRKNC